MRARYPDDEGEVVRDGVQVFYEVYGSGAPTVLLVPPWQIVHSRVWKMQVPYLARHHRVVTFDPRGNGRSDRPTSATAYGERELAADALAVLDATGTDRAVVVTFSSGAQRSLVLAAEHPARVEGLVFIAPSVPLAPGHPEREVPFEEVLDTDEGWARFNAHHWRRDYPGFVEFFAGRCASEPHSTKLIEDMVGWGLETDAATLIETVRAPALTEAEARELCSRLSCPVLVVHGDEDAVRPHTAGIELARVTGGTLALIEGGSHLVHARQPVRVNLLIRDFLRQFPVTTRP